MQEDKSLESKQIVILAQLQIHILKNPFYYLLTRGFTISFQKIHISILYHFWVHKNITLFNMNSHIASRTMT